MAEEAQMLIEPEVYRFTAAAAYSSGQVVQLPDGRAGVIAGLKALASGDAGEVYTKGVFKVAKTTSMVVLDGQKLYWDAANNKAKYTGDFYIGVAVEDAAASDTTVKVALNVVPKPVIDLAGLGTWQEAATNGLGVVEGGGAHKLAFDAVAEAAMAALYSDASLALDQKPIFEAWLAIFDIGDNAALDINFGIANATHATDADQIAESVFFHLDGSALDIKAESDDGTTEVAATDTTVDAVDNAYTFFQIDARDLSDVKLYINGVRVLSGTTFVLSAATGPIFPIVHLEKTSDDTVADVRVREMALRTGLR